MYAITAEGYRAVTQEMELMRGEEKFLMSPRSFFSESKQGVDGWSAMSCCALPTGR